MSFALIGKNISHSYSAIIHKSLGYYDYNLIDLNEDQLESFIEEGNFSGLNVTIPFKEKIMNYVECDDISRNLGACNTVYRKDGRLLGTNTDFFGFMYLLSYNKIDVRGKSILILGNGGSAKTISSLLKLLEPRKISIATRSNLSSIENKKSDIQYINYNNLPKDAEIIINTTPVGTYPDIDNSPIKDIKSFKKCELIIDIIYNPSKTKLMMMAEDIGIKAVNGLPMLVAQATKSAEFFIGVNLLSYNNQLISSLHGITQNITLVGMGGAGKSHIGKELATAMNRPFVDIDDIITERTKLSIDELIKSHGESYFRDLEEDVIKQVAKETGQVIATGGGALTRSNNIDNIRAKSLVIYLDRDVNELTFNEIFKYEKRPLYHTYEEWKAIYNKRYPSYEKLADIKILNNNDSKETVKEIIERIGSYYEKNNRN